MTYRTWLRIQVRSKAPPLLNSTSLGFASYGLVHMQVNTVRPRSHSLRLQDIDWLATYYYGGSRCAAINRLLEMASLGDSLWTYQSGNLQHRIAWLSVSQMTADVSKGGGEIPGIQTCMYIVCTLYIHIAQITIQYIHSSDRSNAWSMPSHR